MQITNSHSSVLNKWDWYWKTPWRQNRPKGLRGYERRPPLAVTETLVWVGRAAGRQAGTSGRGKSSWMCTSASASALLPSEWKIFTLYPKLHRIFFTFWKSENNETYQSKLIAAAPASPGHREILLVWNVDLVIGWSSVTVTMATKKKKKRNKT